MREEKRLATGNTNDELSEDDLQMIQRIKNLSQNVDNGTKELILETDHFLNHEMNMQRVD